MIDEVKNAVNIIKEYLALDKDIEGNEYLDSLKVMVQALESQSMRDATEEERKSVKDYIESISKPTGVQFETQPFINKPCVSEGVCREDKIQVLNKIRAEIEEIKTYDGVYIGRAHVLQIIDKYKAEMEVEE